jgi:DUF1680 family protein
MVKYIDSSFWNERIAVTRTATLPAVYGHLKKTGQWDALRLQWKKGDPNQPHIFWDSDTAKAVESLCYALSHMQKDDAHYADFRSWLEDAVDMISKAQQSDGYINSYFTVVKPESRWKDICHKHELYCAGHLLEAAVAHYETTGRSTLLDVLCKYVDYICEVFGPRSEQLHGYPGHQEIELALVKLYKVRPYERYLNLLKYFIEERGQNDGDFYAEEAKRAGVDPMKWYPGEDSKVPFPDPPCFWYMQADKPIRELDEINGHSVRAMYYLCGAQGLANLTGDSTLTAAVSKLFADMVDSKFYIHGGIGAIHLWEGFSGKYELPLDCYAETCASIGILFVGQQMLQNKLDSSVSRVMERALYNDVIGGVSLDGKSFFYNQPLIGCGLKRSDWFSTSCCPPNVSRLLNSLENYVFTESDDGLSVSTNFWIGSVFEGKELNVSIDTEYPFVGRIAVELTSTRSVEYAIIAPENVSIKYGNGGVLLEDGYIHFGPKRWNKETILIEYDIRPKIIKPDFNIKSVRGMLAIERGPFVYGIEQSMSPIPLSEITLSQHSSFKEQTVEIKGTKVPALDLEVDNGKVARFIPYFSLGNNSPGEDFRVYIRSAD